MWIFGSAAVGLALALLTGWGWWPSIGWWIGCALVLLFAEKPLRDQ